MQKQALLLIAAVLAASGCAPKNWDSEENGAFDPFEGANRLTYKFNKGVDTVLLKPAATVYDGLPSVVKTGVGNVFNNLSEPANVVNNALQKEGDGTFNSTARFTFNTVFGIGGLVDVASMWGIPHHKADLGQTLRGYGLRDTAYFVLPILGPTTFTDAIGRSGDAALKPQTYLKDDGARYAVYAVNGLHVRAGLLETTQLVEDIAVDEYIFVRDAYEEKRLQIVPTDIWGR